MALKERLKEIRTIKSLTVEQLAFVLKIPGRTISSYERGEHVPPASYLKLLNEQLMVNINYILSGVGSLFVGLEKSEYEQFIRGNMSLSERDIELLMLVTDFLDRK